MTKRGGARPGAGRPRGSLNKRSVEAIEAVAEQFPDWSPLQHFAAVANDENLDPMIRLDAAKAAAPFIHPRPKSVELDPDALVELEARITRVKLEAQAQLLHDRPDLAERLARASQREIVVITGIERSPDQPAAIEGNPSEALADRLARAGVTYAPPAPRLSPPEEAPSASPAPPAGPAPAAPAAPTAKPAEAPAPAPAPTPEPYRPMFEAAPRQFSGLMDPTYKPFES